MSATEGKVPVNGVEIHYEKVGHGDHVVLLMPGAMGTTREHFGPQLENLNRDKLTIIAIDPRGLGKSRPPDRDTPPDFLYRDAHDAAGLMQALGFENYSLVGWSDGGNSAAILAAKYPDRVKKIFIWGANSYMTDEDSAVIKGVLDQVSGIPLSGKPLSELEGSEYTVAVTKEWSTCMLKLAENKDENGEADLFRNELPKIKAETLVAHGTADEYVPFFHAEYLRKHIKNARLKAWENGNHDLHLKDPAKFNAMVEEFVCT